MNRRHLLPVLALAPLLYPIIAMATGAIGFKIAIQFAALALVVGSTTLIGPYVSSRIRLFRGSQFWATETGLLIVLFGFLTPLFSLTPDSHLFTALSQHLWMPALMSASCLAGVLAIVEGSLVKGNKRIKGF